MSSTFPNTFASVVDDPSYKNQHPEIDWITFLFPQKSVILCHGVADWTRVRAREGGDERVKTPSPRLRTRASQTLGVTENQIQTVRELSSI